MDFQMPEIAHTAQDMISNMTPVLQPGHFVYISTQDPTLTATLTNDAVSTFREEEGLSMLVPVQSAQNAGLSVDLPMRCITLNVYSSLEGVGLTAAVAAALGAHNVPCNMVAACHHDHVFVPSDKCDQALRVLKSLQRQAAEET